MIADVPGLRELLPPPAAAGAIAGAVLLHAVAAEARYVLRLPMRPTVADALREAVRAQCRLLPAFLLLAAACYGEGPTPARLGSAAAGVYLVILEVFALPSVLWARFEAQYDRLARAASRRGRGTGSA